MAKAEQDSIEAVSPLVCSDGEGEERVLRRGDINDGLGSRTCCTNGPTDRGLHEIGSREFPKNHQNSHGMECDGSCHMKSEPILNNEVGLDIAAKLKEKLNLNGMNIVSSSSDCLESVHIGLGRDEIEVAARPSATASQTPEDDHTVLGTAAGVAFESGHTTSTRPSREVNQQSINTRSRHLEEERQIEDLPLYREYELPENLEEPFSVANLIPPTDGDIDVIPGKDGEKPVKLIAYESERQIQAIMTLITKDLSEPYSIYTYRYFIHNWPNLCFLAMHEGTCVGAIVCKLDNHKKLARRGYIAMLAVDQAFRKRKIGSNLVRKAIRTMIRDDCDEVVLETEITNKPALRLYENLGFVRDKRLFRYYLNGVDALRLKLWLR